MNIKASIAISLMLLCGAAHAQKTDTVPKTTSFVAIGIGGDLAVGRYANTTGNGFGQYGEGGVSRYISAGVVVNKFHIGFVITEGAYNNVFNSGKYIGNLKAADSLKDAKFVDQGSATLYTGAYGMFGFLFDLKVHKLTLDLKVMGGRFTTFFPEIEYYEAGTNTAGNYSYTQFNYLSTETFSLGFDLGFNARFAFSKHVCAMITAEYLYSKFYYGTVENNSNANVGNECVVSLLNFTGGIAYQF